jgi:uncharacterized membrane protein YkvA (DUF1232 family)
MTAWSWAGLGLLAAFAAYAAAVSALVVLGRRGDAAALARFVPDCVVLFRRLAADDRVPRSSRLAIVALAGYLAMPLDLIPDVIPVAGQLDDAILVMLVLRRLVRSAGPGLVTEHWPGPERSLRVLLKATVPRSMVEGPA